MKLKQFAQAWKEKYQWMGLRLFYNSDCITTYWSLIIDNYRYVSILVLQSEKGNSHVNQFFLIAVIGQIECLPGITMNPNIVVKSLDQGFIFKQPLLFFPIGVTNCYQLSLFRFVNIFLFQRLLHKRQHLHFFFRKMKFIVVYEHFIADIRALPAKLLNFFLFVLVIIVPV